MKTEKKTWVIENHNGLRSMEIDSFKKAKEMRADWQTDYPRPLKIIEITTTTTIEEKDVT